MSPKTTQFTERISTFLTPEQVEALKQIASKRGLTLSALIRVVLLDHIGKE